MTKNHFQNSLKHLRFDNGAKFLIKFCQSIFDEFGVIHKKICAYTPQQNGIVESKLRTLLQLVIGN